MSSPVLEIGSFSAKRFERKGIFGLTPLVPDDQLDLDAAETAFGHLVAIPELSQSDRLTIGGQVIWACTNANTQPSDFARLETSLFAALSGRHSFAPIGRVRGGGTNDSDHLQFWTIAGITFELPPRTEYGDGWFFLPWEDARRSGGQQEIDSGERGTRITISPDRGSLTSMAEVRARGPDDGFRETCLSLIDSTVVLPFEDPSLPPQVITTDAWFKQCIVQVAEREGFEQVEVNAWMKADTPTGRARLTITEPRDQSLDLQSQAEVMMNTYRRHVMWDSLIPALDFLTESSECISDLPSRIFREANVQRIIAQKSSLFLLLPRDAVQLPPLSGADRETEVYQLSGNCSLRIQPEEQGSERIDTQPLGTTSHGTYWYSPSPFPTMQWESFTDNQLRVTLTAELTPQEDEHLQRTAERLQEVAQRVLKVSMFRRATPLVY